MFKYCPSCASRKIVFEREKVFRCQDCGLTHYQNTAAATACVIRSEGGLVLLVRGKEPAKGKLHLPGGFVDNGEGAFEGIRRELREEIGWEPPWDNSADVERFRLFASFPNIYPYKGFIYHTCDLFFAVDAPDLREEDIRPEKTEVAAARFVKPENLNLEEFAFDSARRAMRVYLETICPK